MPRPTLRLNMIVKNEAARIIRCLTSVAPYITAYSILDTGSTDNTVELIKTFFEREGIPGHVHHGVFTDYSQARNMAFSNAQRDNDVPWCKFALLVDADMELVVEDEEKFFGAIDPTAPSYNMMQRGGCVSYANRRLINLNCPKPPYVGVTHEYIDVVEAGMLEGAYFVDHADGANRGEKFPRDAMLLEAALKNEPDNGRYWYYLGNTYRDWGKPRLAAVAYQRRIALGGWEEETHSAMMNYACCLKDQGDHDGFVAKMIEAYNFRPHRTEPLYDLAKYFRERGNNAASVLFSKPSLNVKAPTGDLLFVNNYVYTHGHRYEYSICGAYLDTDRDSAFQITNDLALDPTSPPNERWGSRQNLYWHTKPLSAYCPSKRSTIIDFTPPAGYTAMNPSITRWGHELVCNVRCVNYRMDEQGRYLINGTDGEANGTNPIDTKNFVCTLDDDLKVTKVQEIIWHRPAPEFNLVTGLEDVRLYERFGQLYFSACVREANPAGLCQQARGVLTQVNKDFEVRRFEIISGWSSDHEKNWMPIPSNREEDTFVYRLDTLVHHNAEKRVATVNPASVYVNDISGSSQLIPFKAGWLAVVHEAVTGPDGKRTYWHRFAWFDSNFTLRRLSLPFVFYSRQIEFCAGLAYHPNKNDLVLSFGVRDAEAHLATVSIEEVAQMTWKFHES